MQHRYLTLYSLFLVACAPPPVVEPQYLEYLAIFNREAANRGLASNSDSTSVITADSMPDNVVGSCSMGRNEVHILRSYWNWADHSRRESLIFHELGHCVLFYEHTNNYPAIMFPYALNSEIYINNRSMLLDKFFSGSF